jgi:hypothetical protein
MVKHTEDLLVTKIFSFCLVKPVTISEITRHIYGNDYAKNEITIYRTIENLIKEGYIIPTVDKGLRYQINFHKIIKILIENKAIIQVGKDTFKLKLD